MLSAIRPSSLPPMTGTFTLTSSSTTSAVPAPRASRRTVPVAVVGLPGAVTETVPPAREVQCSSMTARVVSPAIFLAIAGRPAVFCTWSLTRVKPSSVGVRSMSWETTPWASQTFARKAGSASIAKTSSGGAS